MRITIPLATLVMAISGSAYAQIAPTFSVGRSGPSGLGTEVLYVNVGGVPTPVAGGAASGLTMEDAIDGFSQPELVNEFLFCFSVSGSSTGILDLDPVGNFPFAPFNVTNQAARGQALGDAFLSTKAFNRAGILGVGPSMPDRNNVLAINQSQSYFSDFGLQSAFNPDTDVAGAPMDDVAGGGSPVQDKPLFFTLDSTSTTFDDNLIVIDFDSEIGGVGGNESIWLTAADLGLVAGDTINAMSVFDSDITDNIFSENDQLLFSLASGSPLLGAMGWSAADVLTFSFGDSAVTVFANHTDLGLLPSDEIDMLELVPLRGDAESTIRSKVPAPGTVSLLGVVCALTCSRRRR